MFVIYIYDHCKSPKTIFYGPDPFEDTIASKLMKNKARLDHPRLLVRVGDDAPGDYRDYCHCDDHAVIVGKMRRQRKHYFSAILSALLCYFDGQASTVFFAFLV